MSLEYISYEDFKSRNIPLERIKEFDCGNSNFNMFLRFSLTDWQEKLAGVTYFLIDTAEQDLAKVIIYAYVTVSTIGLLNKDIAGYSYISGTEIRLFAVDKHFRGVVDDDGVRYSHIFFALLLQDLWGAATQKISFKMIFLQANIAGKPLYEEFGFVKVMDYISPTEDEKIEIADCIPMLCEITDEMMYRIFE